MTVDWRPVDSTRIVAEAYDADTEMIYVRFPDGVEWCYEACPRETWKAFTAPGQSRGEFIHKVLDHKPNHRYSG